MALNIYSNSNIAGGGFFSSGSFHGWDQFFPLLAHRFRIVLVEEYIPSSQVLGSFQNSYIFLESQELDHQVPGPVTWASGGFFSSVGALHLKLPVVHLQLLILSSDSVQVSCGDSAIPSTTMLFLLDWKKIRFLSLSWIHIQNRCSLNYLNIFFRSRPSSVMYWAVCTTLYSALRSEAEQFAIPGSDATSQAGCSSS